jgi:hypothetical protein
MLKEKIMNSAFDFLVKKEEIGGEKSSVNIDKIKEEINEYLQILFCRVPDLEKYFSKFLEKKVSIKWENYSSGELGRTEPGSEVGISIHQNLYETSDGKTRASELYLKKEIDFSTAISLIFIHEFFHACWRFYVKDGRQAKQEILAELDAIPKLSSYARLGNNEIIPEFLVELILDRNLTTGIKNLNKIILIMIDDLSKSLIHNES